MGEEAGIVLVQMISTCLRGAYGRGGGSQHLVLDTETARHAAGQPQIVGQLKTAVLMR
jgi:hypothetical protein